MVWRKKGTDNWRTLDFDVVTFGDRPAEVFLELTKDMAAKTHGHVY